MNPIEQRSANPVLIARTGLVAALRGLLRSGGSGVPYVKRPVFFARTLALTGLVSLCALAFAGAPALAAAPETPEALPPTEVRATTATLHGVLDPLKAGGPFEANTYEFVYRQSPTACQGAGEVKTPEGLSLGGGKEEVSQGIEGLTANTQYTVCLVAHNEAKTEEAISPPVTFTTVLPPEGPETSSPAKSITATTAVLEGTLNPHANVKAGWFFYYSPYEGGCPYFGSAVEPEVVGEGLKEDVEVTGLEPHTKYVFCMVATNATGEQAQSANEVSFETLAAAPMVLGESAPSVTPTTARLEGVVNPSNESTECHFEYGVASVSEHDVPCEQPLLEGIEPLGVGLSVTGLTQHTTYHYRIVAKNATGIIEGEEEEFTTGTPEPPETKAASEVGPFTAKLHGILNPNHAGEAGSYEFVYRESPSECQGEGEKATAALPASGLSPEPVLEEVAGLFPGATYTVCLRALNGASESALGNVVSFATPAVAPTVGEEFVTEVSSGGAVLHGRVNPGGAETTYRFEYGPTTSYGKTLSGDAGGGPEAVPVSVQPQDLAPGVLYHYRLVAGNNIDGEVSGPDRTFTTQSAGATFALPDGRAWEMVSPPSKNGAEVSNAKTAAGGDFQAAENGDAVTYITSAPISASARSNPWEPQVLSSRGPDGWLSEDLSTPHNGYSKGEFVEAKPGSFSPRTSQVEEYYAFSPDLSRAYVQPEAHTPLVPGQPATERNPELNNHDPEYLDGYVRDNTTGTYSITHWPRAVEWYAEQAALVQAPPSCDASASPAKGVGVDAVSRDGCYVYFNSEAILAPGASGADPLYVSHYDGSGWTTTFIASLSGTGFPEWGGHYVEVSSNGRYVAFMSSLSLTGFDNRDATSGEPDEEIYLYDAASNRLVCPSCNRSGARPTGQLDNSIPGDIFNNSEVLVDSDAEWAGHWLAGILPEWSLEGLRGFYRAIYQPRYLSDSGRLFFDSPDALVAQDANGLEDVYEYEPEGVGSCGSGVGCVSLISSGTSSRESAFVDASTGGNDVFFITRSRLSAQDVDNSYDIYDAHVCTASVPCVSALASPAACETSDSCKAPPTPQPGIFGAPASGTFAGAGNAGPIVPVPAVKKRATKCAKGKKLSRGRCVKKSKVKRKPATRRKSAKGGK